MMYLGIGNAGSKILWAFRKQLELPDQPQESREPLKHPTAFNGDCFAVGDADPNNSVLHRVREEGLGDLDPPIGVRVYDIDRYWNGGCGVYHVIGELVAQAADADGATLRLLSGRPAGEPVTILFSAGGGTGGGVSDQLSVSLNALGRPTRLIAILPEVDTPAGTAQPPLVVKGPDDFQCAAAGRLLTKVFHQVSQPLPNPRDVFLVSNSVLADIPNGVDTYLEAFERLNRYVSQLLLLMPTVATFPPNNRVSTLGLGLGVVGAAPADFGGFTSSLIASALAPLNLGNKAPNGLSALPMELASYGGALSQLLAGDARDGSPAKILGNIFRRTFTVTGYLWASSPSAHEALALGNVATLLTNKLQNLFGPSANVALVSRQATSANEFYPGIPSQFFPSQTPGGNVALLLALENPIVEDAYRMFAYFAESSFDWQADTVGDVATFLQRCLVARPPGEGGWGQSSNVQLNWIQNSQDPHAHLDPGVREDYPERFWGNIEDLRDKVLQSLNLTPINYDACLLQPVHLAGALAYLCKLAFHGTSMPTSPAPANP